MTVEIDSEDWIAIVEGGLDGTQAYMSGKMKVKGDMNLLFTLDQLFPTMRASSDTSDAHQRVLSRNIQNMTKSKDREG